MRVTWKASADPHVSLRLNICFGAQCCLVDDMQENPNAQMKNGFS